MNFTVVTQVRGQEPLWTALSVLAAPWGPPGSAPGRKPTQMYRLSPTVQSQASSSRHTGSNPLPGTFEGAHFRDPVAGGQSSLHSGPVCHLGLNKPHLPSVRPLGAHLSQLLPDANPPPVAPGEHVATEPHRAACACWAAGLAHPPACPVHPACRGTLGQYRQVGPTVPKQGLLRKQGRVQAALPRNPRFSGPARSHSTSEWARSRLWA